MLDSWLPFLMYGTLALVIPASMILMSFVFATRPARRTKTRRVPFESGVSQGPPQANRFTVGFYLTAMLFIVFDIEIIFLYPWAVAFGQDNGASVFLLVEMVLFIATVFVAYAYVWRRGGLEWD